MPADEVLWDEAGCLDAVKAFVVAACKGAVKPADVYRWRPAASPSNSTRPTVTLAPVNALPIYASPMGEESDSLQHQRWTVTIDTAAEGDWTIGALGVTAPAYTAGPLDTPTTVRDALAAALDGLALPLDVTTNGAAAIGILGDIAGQSLSVQVTPPEGGAATRDIIDDNIRRAVYNFGEYTVRLVIRDVPTAQTGGRSSVALSLAERIRLWFQASALPVVNGSAYPYRSDLLSIARMSWRQTRDPQVFDEQDATGWNRAVALDVVFDVPCALLHDVPSLDAIGLSLAIADP